MKSILNQSTSQGKTLFLLCLSLLFFRVNAQSCLNCITNDSINNGLIACYPFNGNANDKSGNGNNVITNTATLTTDRFGRPNSAYLFNGLNGEYIKCTNTNMPLGAAPRTISLWVKYNGIVNSAQTLTALSYGVETSSNAQGIGLYNGKIRFFSWLTDFDATYAYDSSSWFHLVAIYQNGTASVYVNGTLVGTAAKSWNTLTSAELFIGTRPDALNSFFNGKIDDIRIYNRGLTSAEIQKLYTATCEDSVGYPSSSSAQNCINCTSTAGINNGLLFCTTMTGNANDGTASPVTPTITGTVIPTTDRYGTSNSAYDFTNSLTTKITYSTSSKLDVPIGQSYTMGVWFYQRDIPSTPSYIAALFGIDASAFMLITSAGKLWFDNYYGPGLNSRIKFSSPNNINLNAWNHAAITIDKITGLHTLYLNGVVVATGNSINNTALSTPKVVIGNNTVNDWGINGKVDDVRIYNRALSASEIGRLYASTIPAVSVTSRNQSICKGDTIELNAGTNSIGSLSWSPALSLNSSIVVKPIAKPVATTTYTVTVQNGGCTSSDSTTIKVDSINLFAADQNVCIGNSFNLSASGATSYVWIPSAGLSSPNIANPTIASAKTAFYTVKGTSGTCTAYDTVVITACMCIPVYDTIRTHVTDTIHLTIRDTLTTYITFRDTAHIIVNDTVLLTLRDTIRQTITDTIHKTIMDTIHVVIRDTVPVGVTDTLYINIVKTGLNLPDNILNTLKIYPNPATDEVVIDNGNFALMPNYTVRIINITGQTVFTSGINRQTFRIQTSSIGSVGIYFVQVLDNNNSVIQTKKLVLR